MLHQHFFHKLTQQNKLTLKATLQVQTNCERAKCKGALNKRSLRRQWVYTCKTLLNDTSISYSRTNWDVHYLTPKSGKIWETIPSDEYPETRNNEWIFGVHSQQSHQNWYSRTRKYDHAIMLWFLHYSNFFNGFLTMGLDSSFHKCAILTCRRSVKRISWNKVVLCLVAPLWQDFALL